MAAEEYPNEVLDSFRAQIKEGLAAYPPERIRKMTRAVKSPYFEAAQEEASKKLGEQSADGILLPSLVAREMATEMIDSGWLPGQAVEP